MRQTCDELNFWFSRLRLRHYRPINRQHRSTWENDQRLNWKHRLDRAYSLCGLTNAAKYHSQLGNRAPHVRPRRIAEVDRHGQGFMSRWNKSSKNNFIKVFLLVLLLLCDKLYHKVFFLLCHKLLKMFHLRLTKQEAIRHFLPLRRNEAKQSEEIISLILTPANLRLPNLYLQNSPKYTKHIIV